MKKIGTILLGVYLIGTGLLSLVPGMEIPYGVTIMSVLGLVTGVFFLVKK